MGREQLRRLTFFLPAILLLFSGLVVDGVSVVLLEGKRNDGQTTCSMLNSPLWLPFCTCSES